MEKPGCPFNHFGPCLKEKCKFYLPVLDKTSDCAILGAYTESLCAHVDTALISSAVFSIQTLVALPFGAEYNKMIAEHEHNEIYRLMRFSAELKRLGGSLFVDPVLQEQAQVCLGKVNRILDILCEEDEDNYTDDE